MFVVDLAVVIPDGGVGRDYIRLVAAVGDDVVGTLREAQMLAFLFKEPDREHSVRRGFFGWFNRRFDWGRDHYLGGVRGVMARTGRWAVIYLAIVAVVGLLFMKLPTAFVPNEDQGYFFVQVQTPPGATQQRTGVVLDDISQYLLKQESASVNDAFIANGNNFAGRGQTQGMLFVHLKDWSQRTRADQSVQALISRTAKHFATYQDAKITPVNPPPIQGLGTAAGRSKRDAVRQDALAYFDHGVRRRSPWALAALSLRIRASGIVQERGLGLNAWRRSPEPRRRPG